MKSPLFKNIKTSSESEGIRLNRRVITFLVCVLISVFFWLLMSLSKEYDIVLSFPVKYINMPEDKIVANQLPETVDIEIKSNGFNLLIYKLKQHRETVLIDVKDSQPMAIKNHYCLPTNSRIDKITSQFNSNINVLNISPDTILLNFNKKVTKSVPVKANLNIVFDSQYQQTDSVRLTPAYINISGAADVLDAIDHVETVPMSFKNVKSTLSAKLMIEKTPELKLLELSQSSVMALVNVAKYTEASIELPIEVENLPAGFNLKTFPDKVVVKYNVAFENYEKMNALQFRAIVDYSKIEQGSNKLKVQLVKYPSDIRAVKLSTEKVEYIIRK